VFDRPTAPPSDAVAVEVRGLSKGFRVPRTRLMTLKERALHPLQRTEFDQLQALDGISFDVHAGEFFGIVGRNGSGKSTLLKCLAGIYRADAGSIRIAGRLSPFIELGVGFNPDLTARDNVLINSVMMGLTPRQARERFDAIVEFAELEDFLEMKLKNYSSGMQVRLAFSVMVQSDADVLLIDEVLAVGDAAFQQKCLDVFYGLREQGRTVVLVTHDMAMVDRFCHRAMLIHDSHVEVIGPAGEVGRRYLELNFASQHAGSEPEPEPDAPRERASVVDAWVSSAAGERIGACGSGEAITLHAIVEAHADLEDVEAIVWIDSPEGTRVFGAATSEAPAAPRRLAAGERLEIRVALANRLAPSHYSVGASLTEGTETTDFATFRPRLADLVVFDSTRHFGLIALDREVSVARIAAPGKAAAPR
jgi:ABC-2 type transport system ATP-binding protein